MARVEIQSLTIHGDKDQEERSAVLEEFKTGEINLLIATDVTARGIDIPDVQIVVNYDLPDDAENYVHRIGRTGRGKNRGHAYTFCATEENPMLKEIQSFLDAEIKVLKLTKSAYKETLEIERERKYDYMSLIADIEEHDSKKRKNKKSKK